MCRGKKKSSLPATLTGPEHNYGVQVSNVKMTIMITIRDVFKVKLKLNHATQPRVEQCETDEKIDALEVENPSHHCHPVPHNPSSGAVLRPRVRQADKRVL